MSLTDTIHGMRPPDIRRRLRFGRRDTMTLRVGDVEAAVSIADRGAWDWFTRTCADGFHEPVAGQAFVDAIQPGDVVLDVGAHFGAFSALAAAAGAEKIVAVDVAGERLRCLHEHPELAAVDFETVVAAAWGETGELVSFGADRADLPATTRVGSGNRRVPTVALDDLEVRPDVVKMDIEGAEARAIPAAVNKLASARVVLLEVHHGALREFDATGEDVLTALEEFEIEWLRTGPVGTLIARRGGESR